MIALSRRARIRAVLMLAIACLALLPAGRANAVPTPPSTAGRIVFDGSPEIVQAVQDWITPEWLCSLASASGGGVAEHGGHGVAGVERLPGHKDVDVNCYESDSAKTFASAVTTALAENTFAFDASDLMPPEVGQETFWTGMIDWTTGTPTQDVVDAIEGSWPS